jgi:NhaP-type Na+/H+ or K+/H+ antiporter
MAVSMISVAVLFFLGHALGWFFEKTKIPDLLIILIIGYLLGPVFGYLTPEAFGQSGRLISTVALVVILYQGGLTLTANQLKSCFGIASLLSILSFFSIAILTAVLCLIFGGYSLPICILAGLGVGSTSSAIVIPMVKTLSITDRTKTILSLESSFTDVLAIVIFLVVADGVEKNIFSPAELLIKIGPNTVLATLCGFAFAMIWGIFKKRFNPIFKMVFAGEAWALLAYGIIEVLGLNGGIGVLAMGFTLANLNLIPKRLQNQISLVPVSYRDMSLLNELIFMLRTFFFIYLGVLIKFSNLQVVIIAILVTVAVFVTRYFITLLLFGRETPKLDLMTVTAMGPRGLACAVLATIPFQRGFVDGIFVQNVVFAVIPLTILVTAILVALFENNKVRAKLQGFW